jgi:hypothetical protein
MINRTRTFPRGHLIKLHLGGLYIIYTSTKKENAVSMLELERLEQVRKLKEEFNKKKITRTDIVIEGMFLQKL